MSTQPAAAGDPLDQWITREYRFAAKAMLRSISATTLVKQRPGFGQTVVPKAGSILASPERASYDPDPDYFFHWYRDSAIVLDALRLVHLDGTLASEGPRIVRDFVTFNIGLAGLDGADVLAGPDRWDAAKPDFRQYLRADDDLAMVRGERILGETRVNPDGTLDISRWPRPQNDGPAARALTLLRWFETDLQLADEAGGAAQRLVETDLAYTARHWRSPCFDLWEEQSAHHYYTMRIQAAALAAGSRWLAAQGRTDLGDLYAAEAAAILARLDDFWLADEAYYRSRIAEPDVRGEKDLDIAVILATIHAGETGPTHSVLDPRVLATLTRLEELFEASYDINRTAAAPAMGRYANDVYYAGGAYFFATFAAAEVYFRLAAAIAGGADLAITPESQRFLAAAMVATHAGRPQIIAALIRRGEQFLETARAHIPPNGEISEQFDRRTGAPSSAKNLTWSYAALITAVHARRAAVQGLPEA